MSDFYACSLTIIHKSIHTLRIEEMSCASYNKRYKITAISKPHKYAGGNCRYDFMRPSFKNIVLSKLHPILKVTYMYVLYYPVIACSISNAIFW